MPPKAKKKKITWCNSSCKADKCLEPPSKSIWLNCDVCGYWYHEDCIGVKAEDYPEDLEFYCFKCHPAKLEEYDSLKAKLLIKVRELAEAQKDFKGPTISRDMFKEKKNAGQYNFSSDFPPTLTDLCLRINGQYKTFGDFKYESTQWINRLKELLLEKYESDLQFIDWEFQDFVEDLLKGEEEEEEPDDASSEEQQAALDAELLALNDTFDEELDVESTNKSFEHTVIKTEIPDEYLEDFVRVVPSVGKCQNCSTDITDINVTIYLCKRKHKICQDCRVINPGRICPTCHDVHGDRKRLMKDSVFQNDIKTKKVRKRKSPDNALPKIGDSWSCTATSSNVNPSRIPPSSPSSLDTSIVDVMNVPIKQELDLIQENLFSSSEDQQDEGSACAIQSVRSLNPFSWNPPDLSDSGGTELIEADFNITSLAEVATNELVRLTDATGPSIQLQENVMFSEDVVVQHDSHLQGFNKLVPKFPSLPQDFQENVILTEVLDVPESDEGMNHHVLEPQTMDPFHALQQCSNQELQQCSDQELIDQVVHNGGRWVHQAEFEDEIELQTLDQTQGNQSNMQYGLAVWNTPQNVNMVDSQTATLDGYIRVQGQDIKLPQKPVQIGQPIVVQTRSLEESRQMKGLNSMLSKIPSSILDKIPNTEPQAPQQGETSLSTVWNADSFVQRHPMPIPRGSPVKSSTQQVQNNQAMNQRSSRSQNRLAAQGATQVPSPTQQQKLGLQLVNTSKLLESGN